MENDDKESVHKTNVYATLSLGTFFHCFKQYYSSAHANFLIGMEVSCAFFTSTMLGNDHDMHPILVQMNNNMLTTLLFLKESASF